MPPPSVELSVIIPTFKLEREVQEAVRCVLSETRVPLKAPDFNGVKPLEITFKPGMTIFIPKYHWHGREPYAVRRLALS